jgi:hypothetical protein
LVQTLFIYFNSKHNTIYIYEKDNNKFQVQKDTTNIHNQKYLTFKKIKYKHIKKTNTKKIPRRKQISTPTLIIKK